MRPALTLDTCARPDFSFITRAYAETVQARGWEETTPVFAGKNIRFKLRGRCSVSSRGAARMGISLNAEPNTGEDRDPILGPNFAAAKELFTGSEISPALDSLERCNEQVNGREKLSNDLQEKVLALYDEYRPRLFRYLRSMRLGRDAADEVIQETFMRLTMEILKDGNIENVPGWIVKVSHNLAVDLLKKLREPVTTDEGVAFLIENRADTALSPEELYSKKEQSKKMKFALSTFKPLHRQCFQLRTQGFRYKEIALAAGISEQRAAFIVKQVAVRLAAICG